MRHGGDRQRVERGFQTLDDLRIERFSHAPLRERIWQLRDNLTAYDAAYFALAEALDVPLWTRDAKLADAPGASVRVEII
ncbi:MAG: type II toxin-antitoxin system VapC family toxin [Oceanicaulis sp.]